MGISRYNREGYFDPTMYGALSRIEREEKKARRTRRMVVYICSPFSGEQEKNVEKARRYSRFAARRSCVPVAPHLLFPQFLDEAVPAERGLARSMGLALLGRCDQLWVFGGRISEGMAAEIERAEKRNMVVRYFSEEMEEVDAV